jgi:hypothetical protein
LSGFWIGGSHVAGGSDGACFGCDQVASSEAFELRGRRGASWDERAHFRRLRDAYEERGEEGLIDRRRGWTSGLRALEDEIAWTADTFQTRYFDSTIKHFHEQALGLTMRNGKPFKRSYSWTKSVLHLHGLTTRAPKRGVHRRKRERRPLPGMMLFQDGSKQAWLGQGPHLDLIVTMDDATRAILSIFPVEEEGPGPDGAGLRYVAYLANSTKPAPASFRQD